MRLDLPIAPFAVLDVPALLHEALEPSDARELGSGAVFGSTYIELSREVAVTDVDQVDTELRQRIFAFDWWIQNADRNLTRFGGNPNLLWVDGGPILIDHNLAFDPAYSLDQQFELHVFSEAARYGADWVNKNACCAAMQSALADWPDLVSKIPDQWRFADDERTVATDFDFVMAHMMLSRCMDPRLWDVT
jgi:hypothetical protein